MLRRGAALLLRRSGSSSSSNGNGSVLLRSFADDAAAAASSSSSSASSSAVDGAASRASFLEKFKPLVSSTTAPPMFPTDFFPKEDAKDEAAATAGVPDKLKFSFYLPHGQPVDRQPVDLVLLPAVTGDFGVMPGHVPTVAQLRPGVVAVHAELDKEVEKYFVSSGFAFVHDDSSAEVCAVEAVKVSDLDPEAVRAGLAEHTAKLAALQAKGDDYEIAAAQVGVEVFSAMSSAVGAS